MQIDPQQQPSRISSILGSIWPTEPESEFEADPSPSVKAVQRRRSKDDVLGKAEIQGDDTQIALITLPPGTFLFARPSTAILRSRNVQMRTRVAPRAGRRFLAGHPLWQVEYTTSDDQPGTVVLGRRIPCKLLRLCLSDYPSGVLIRSDSLVAMPGDGSVTLGVQRAPSFLTWLFGGQGLFLQRAHGTGTILLSAGGPQIQRQLRPGESWIVASNSLVAFRPDVTYNVQRASGPMNVLVGDEGLFVTTVTGPGTVWLQGFHPQYFVRTEVHSTHSDHERDTRTRMDDDKSGGDGRSEQ